LLNSISPISLLYDKSYGPIFCLLRNFLITKYDVTPIKTAERTDTTTAIIIVIFVVLLLEFKGTVTKDPSVFTTFTVTLRDNIWPKSENVKAPVLAPLFIISAKACNYVFVLFTSDYLAVPSAFNSGVGVVRKALIIVEPEETPTTFSLDVSFIFKNAHILSINLVTPSELKNELILIYNLAVICTLLVTVNLTIHASDDVTTK
jgi:hypothetical protein